MIFSAAARLSSSVQPDAIIRALFQISRNPPETIPCRKPNIHKNTIRQAFISAFQSAIALVSAQHVNIGYKATRKTRFSTIKARDLSRTPGSVLSLSMRSKLDFRPLFDVNNSFCVKKTTKSIDCRRNGTFWNGFETSTVERVLMSPGWSLSRCRLRALDFIKRGIL
jgi:hypothetical protein